MQIDVTMGTLGRQQQFKRAVLCLNDQLNAKDIHLYVMDGNKDDDQASHFLTNTGWRFRAVHLVKEHEVLPEQDRGLWPKIYNHLMKMGTSPLVTYWSDDIFPDKDCFTKGAKPFKDAKVGAVAFSWRDGIDKPYKIYGTEMHKQVMVNFGLFRRTVLEEVKFIDDNYKFYNADQDLSLKVWYVGKSVLRCPDAQVTHFSGGKSDNKYRSGEWYRIDSNRFASKWAYARVSRRNVEL